MKPCPFCGSTPEQNSYDYYHRGEEYVVIACVNPSCRVKPSVRQDQSEYHLWNILDAWNERTDQS